MKSTFISLAVVLSMIVLICFIGGVHFPISPEWSNFIQAIAVTLALLVSGIALYYAKKEYDHHKKSEKTALLCQYLQRYANDPYVKKIEDYILDTVLLDDNENIIGFDKRKTSNNIPTLWEKEMFMHFFEEIQLLIDDKMIEKDVIVDLIGYYIGIFHRVKEYHQDITDYDDERYWKYYLRFVRSIPDDFYSTDKNGE